MRAPRRLDRVLRQARTHRDPSGPAGPQGHAQRLEDRSRCVNQLGLDRGIQYAAAFDSSRGVSGILGRPVKCADDGGVSREDYRDARLLNAGLAAGFAAAPDATSQPPCGVATLMASSGCGSAVKVWIASLAAASDWASRRLAISSRLWPASASPCAAARLNHLKDSARFCSTPMPRA